jgi:hypothetical protein
MRTVEILNGYAKRLSLTWRQLDASRLFSGQIMDTGSLPVNGELRFPIYARLAGVAAIDAGRVFSSLGRIGISQWKINPAINTGQRRELFTLPR